MIDHLCPVDISELAGWLRAIPLTDWPQQDRINRASPWPAMVSDPGWHEFAEVTDGLVAGIMQRFQGHFATDRRLSLVVAGQMIGTHDDQQDDSFIARVHVPLETNERAVMTYGADEIHMASGFAYLMDIERMHGIANRGATDRIHFFFDVRTRSR